MRALLALPFLLASEASADIASAKYTGPVDVYGHGVVPNGEYGAMEVALDDGSLLGASPMIDAAVFEDTEPRLVDFDGDGVPEIVTVVAYFEKGAAIRIWKFDTSSTDPRIGPLRVFAEGEPIGTPFRWLAVVGAADLDGDGDIEIAYVDRPHLAKTLRIVSVKGEGLVEEVSLGGVTNHRIGEEDIAGGVRDCGNGPEMLMASADWSKMLSVTFKDGTLETKEIGSDTTRPAFAKALTCS